MSGARITYALDDKAFQGAVQRLGGVIRSGMVRQIGMALLVTTEERFQSQTEPFGAKWAALNPAYAAIKRGTNILTASRALVKSLTMEVSGTRVMVGSNRIYARVHQFGGTIRPKRANALVFRLGGVGPRGGPGFVHARAVTIPARPYLGFGPADQRAVMDVVQGEIRRVFGG